MKRIMLFLSIVIMVFALSGCSTNSCKVEDESIQTCYGDEQYDKYDYYNINGRQLGFYIKHNDEYEKGDDPHIYNIYYGNSIQLMVEGDKMTVYSHHNSDNYMLSLTENGEKKYLRWYELDLDSFTIDELSKFSYFVCNGEKKNEDI